MVYFAHGAETKLKGAIDVNCTVKQFFLWQSKLIGLIGHKAFEIDTDVFFLTLEKNQPGFCNYWCKTVVCNSCRKINNTNLFNI